MNEELKIIIKAVTDSAKREIGNVKKQLGELGSSAKGASGKMGAAFKGIGIAAAATVAAIVAIGAALVNLGKNTIQYNKEQARLISSFQAAGASAKQATETYQGLYRFLGDTGKASEAAAHLAQITTNQKDLAEWTKIAQGVYATFGDSLPIEGLTEAANETIKVGKVTGTMADALNWAGVSEDAFNAKLATTNSLAEREAMVRSTLNDLYNEAAETYERNNKALLDYNESQARLDSAMGSAGAAVLPLLTALNNLGSAFFTALKPALDAIIPPIAAFINWIAKAIQSVMSFFSALTGKSSSIKAVGEIGKSMAGAAQGAQKLGSGMSGAEKAAEGAAKAAEEAKKSTQGFDELNIVSSGKSSSGSDSGAGGGGGSGAGAGIIDTASFGTEVEEAEGEANGLAAKMREIFGGLAEDLKPSIEAWGTAFDNVKTAWNNAKPDFENGATSIKTAFTTLGGYLIDTFIPDVVNSFSTNLAPVFADLASFSLTETGKAFEWFGGVVNTTTNDIVIPYLNGLKTVATDTFDILGANWGEYGGDFLTEAGRLFENLRTSIDTFYNTTFKPVFDNISLVATNVWNNGLKPLVDNVVESALVIGTDLMELYNTVIHPIVEWIQINIMPIVVNAINEAIRIFGDLLTNVTDVISGVTDIIRGIVEFITGVFTGDWDKAWNGIKDIFGGVWEVIKGIAGAAWDAIKLVFAPVGEFFTGVWELISGIFENVNNWFKEKFEDAWRLIKEAFANVKTWFTENVWDKIVDIFKDVGGWFKEKFDAAWKKVTEAFSSVKTWFTDNVWNKITEIFGDVGGWFKEKFDDAWSKIKGVFSDWGTFFSGLWDNIKTTFTSLGTNLGSAIGDAVKSGINGVLSMIENTINKGIDLLNGAVDLINKIPGVGIGKFQKLRLPRLAKGGIVDSATVAMIGEAGKEAVVPLENNTEWMDKLADRIAERNNTPSKIVLTLDGKELGWANIRSINNITKQTGSLPLVIV